jgi:hypothetical protein
MSRLPRSSPWGAVQVCKELIDGVFSVSTAGHGGIMVRKNAADFLSPDALKYGAFKEGSYFCFEEDCCAQVVIRELLDKKLWQIPDLITDKAGYEESINRSLRQWQPEYWAARQLAVDALRSEERTDSMVDARKDIIFRDERYNEKFRIKDGDSIKITVAYDGEEIVRKCRWLDATHMNVGSTCYHMDEFMEKQTRAGNKYEAIPGQEPKLDVVIAEPGKPPRDAEIPITQEALWAITGGKPKNVVTDRLGLVAQIHGNNGAIVVCGINKDNLTSLHPYDAQRQKHELAALVPAAEEKRPTLAERLEAGKAKAAAHEAGRPTPDTPRRAKATAEH